MSTHEKLHVQLSQLRALAMDCDGVLTDNRIFYGGENQWSRFFSIRDGMGIKRLQEAGLKVAIITNSNSEDIRQRARSLKITDLYEGVGNKSEVFRSWLEKHHLQPEQAAYMGDDLQDIEVLKLCGFAATPADGLRPVQEVVHFVSRFPGGHGAVRELCEMILLAKERV